MACAANVDIARIAEEVQVGTTDGRPAAVQAQAGERLEKQAAQVRHDEGQYSSRRRTAERSGQTGDEFTDGSARAVRNVIGSSSRRRCLSRQPHGLDNIVDRVARASVREFFGGSIEIACADHDDPRKQYRPSRTSLAKPFQHVARPRQRRVAHLAC